MKIENIVKFTKYRIICLQGLFTVFMHAIPIFQLKFMVRYIPAFDASTNWNIVKFLLYIQQYNIHHSQ